MTNRYSKFLKSFIDDFSSNPEHISEKTHRLFEDAVEKHSVDILKPLIEAVHGANRRGDEYLGDVVTRVDNTTFRDGILFNDKHLGRVVRNKKSGKLGVVIRSDDTIYRHAGDEHIRSISGQKLNKEREIPKNLSGWELGDKDPANYRTAEKPASELVGVGPYGDVRVAIMSSGGSFRPSGKLVLWFAEDYEDTGMTADVQKEMRKTDKKYDSNRTPYRPSKRTPSANFQRDENGKWYLANPEDFDEETRLRHEKTAESLPDEMSDEDVERYERELQREEEARREKLSKLRISDPDKYARAGIDLKDYM